MSKMLQQVDFKWLQDESGQRLWQNRQKSRSLSNFAFGFDQNPGFPKRQNCRHTYYSGFILGATWIWKWRSGEEINWNVLQGRCSGLILSLISASASQGWILNKDSDLEDFFFSRTEKSFLWLLLRKCRIVRAQCCNDWQATKRTNRHSKQPVTKVFAGSKCPLW